MFDAITMVEKAWPTGVTKATIENCWRHYGLSPYVDNHPRSQHRDLDLNATVKDFDLNEQLNAMGEQMDDL